MTRCKQHFSNYTLHTTRGMTILEVVVALGIMALIIGSITAILLDGFRNKDLIFNQLAAQGEGRKATQDIVNELRGATASSIGAYSLERVLDNELAFYARVDADPLRARVHYFLQGNNLVRGIIKPSGNPLTYNPINEVVGIVAHNVITNLAPIFTYYDQNFTGIEAPLAQPVSVGPVRMIGITLTINKNLNTPQTSFTVQAKATVRNLKSN